MAMHALGRLIEAVMAAQRWKQADVHRRTGLSTSRVSQLVNEPVKGMLDKATVMSLARGLGVPPWVVLDAVLESLGLPTRPNDVTIEDAVRADLSLDESTKRAVVVFVNQLRSTPRPDLSRVEGIRVAEPDARQETKNSPGRN